MQSTTLSRTTDLIEQRIASWVEVGTVPLDEMSDTTTILECARRYIEWEASRRARQVSRTSERAALMRIEADERLRDRVRTVTERIAEELQVAWTEELLASTFVTSKGMVTWASASKDQHLERAEKLEVMAAGDIKTAAIHRAAAAAITSSGQRTLGEAQGV